MSSIYIERLRHIQNEMNAAQSVIAYVSTNRYKAEIVAEPSLAGFSRDFLEQVGKNLETTYFVRLTAEFEGILKDHLSTNHPTYAFPIDRAAWKIDLFLSAVWRKERLPRNAQLRQKLDKVNGCFGLTMFKDYEVTIDLPHRKVLLVPYSSLDLHR